MQQNDSLADGCARLGPKALLRAEAVAGLRARHLAVGETVILLHPPLPGVGISIGMEGGCQQNDSLADG